MYQKSVNHRSKGMTLIEVLVVLVIVAVMAAIMMQMFRGARDTSHLAMSLGNIRVVGMGLLGWINGENGGRFPYAYVNRSENSYPGGFNMGSLPQNHTYWAGAVFHAGYIHDLTSYFSPLQKRYWDDPAFQHRMEADMNAWQWAMIGYGANGIWMPYATQVKGAPMIPLSSVERPGDSILLAEAAPNPSQSSGGKYDGFHAVRPKLMSYPLGVRTPGKVVTYFVDGHAEIMSPDDMGWDEVQAKWKSVDDKARPWAR